MKILGLIKCAAVCLIVASCSTTKKVTTQDNQTDRIPLEERRRFDYFFLEGNRQKHLGNLDVAFDLYKKAMEIDTANAPVRFELANFYLNLRRPFVALEYFQKAAETDPENYYYGNSLARMYMSMEKLEEAIATYPQRASDPSITK